MNYFKKRFHLNSDNIELEIIPDNYDQDDLFFELDTFESKQELNKNVTKKEDNTIKILFSGKKNWKNLRKKDEISTDEISSNICEEEVLKEFLLSSFKIENLIVLAGSGTSLGNIVKGPSMSTLWKSLSNIANFDKINKIIKYYGENIEEFLSLCEAYIQLDLKYSKKVQSFIQDAKAEIIKKCSFVMTEDSLKGHINFLSKLAKRNKKLPRLKLFTTNYDLCFEKASSLLDYVVVDGFSYTSERAYNPTLFKYDMVRREKNAENHGEYLAGVIHLYKIHGSVNWGYKRHKINTGNSDEKILNLNYVYQIEPKENKDPCFIYPAKGKYQQSYVQPFLDLISQFFSSLREPNTCLVVVGFGFNDDHLSEPTFSAIKNNPNLKAIIVDPFAENCVKDKEKIYWKKFYELCQDGYDISFINSDFQNFSKLIPDLKGYNKFEKLGREILLNGDYRSEY